MKERKILLTRRCWPSLVALLALILSCSVQAQETPSATAVIEVFQGDLLAVMKQAEELGYSGRYERLATPVEQSHDLAAIARVAVGRYWRKFSDEQQAQLLEVFSQLSVATYAHQFDGYSGQSFQTLSEEESARGDKLVHTALVDSEGETTRLDYMLRRSGGDWRIINIIADGISDLALKRSEYTSILRREGFDALLDRLRSKIEQYSKEN